MHAGSKHAKFPLALLAKKMSWTRCAGVNLQARKLRLGAAALALKIQQEMPFAGRGWSGGAVSLFACLLFLCCRRVILRGARLLSAFCKLEAKLVPRGACCALQGGAGIIYFGSVARTLREPVMKRTHSRERANLNYSQGAGRGEA